MPKPIIINPFFIAAAGIICWLLDTYAMPHPVSAIQPQLAVINFIIQIIILVVSAVISYAMTPKPKPPKPAALADFDLPTAEEGRAIPVVFGTVWIKGPNVLWYGALRSTAIKAKGGKK